MAAINMSVCAVMSRFNHVSFSYTPEKEVLHDISFYAKPGQKIALVGSTRLVKLLLLIC